MKTLNLEALGLQEMSKQEMINNIGGKIEKIIELEPIEINGKKEEPSSGGGLNGTGSGALGMLAASLATNISLGAGFSFLGDYSVGNTRNSSSTTQTTNTKAIISSSKNYKSYMDNVMGCIDTIYTEREYLSFAVFIVSAIDPLMPISVATYCLINPTLD